jgi:1-acyl-sn-glycerol-3-phosphate acyltransferase
VDPLIIGLCVWRRISYMGKDSLFDNRFLGAFLRAVGTFPVRRGQADIGALREAIRRLKGGSPLVLFPQGTRPEPGQERASHPGIGFLAAKSQVPVIPVYIEGSDKVLPRGAKWFHRHLIRVAFGPPLRFPVQMPHEEVSRQIMDAIFALQPPARSS